MKNTFLFLLVISWQFAISQELSSFLNMPVASNLTTSPDGSIMAWVVNDRGVRNLYIYISSGEVLPVTRYTEDDGQEISSITFTDDSRYILYVLGGSVNRAGEYPNPSSKVDGVDQSIWAVNLMDESLPFKVALGNNPVVWPGKHSILFTRGGQIFQTALEENNVQTPLFKARGNNGNPVYSPDGSQIAFVSNRSDHSFIGIYTPNSKDLIWMAPSTSRDSHPSWSPDGKQIAFIRIPGLKFNQFNNLTGGTNFSIMVGNVENRKAVEIWKSPADDGGFAQYYTEVPLKWTRSGRILFFSEHEGWLHLYSVKPDGNELVDLTPGNCETEMYILTNDEESIYFTSNCEDIDRRHIWRNSISGGDLLPFTNGESIEMFPVLYNGNLYCLQSTWYSPLRLVKYENPMDEPIIIPHTEETVISPIDIRPEQVILKAEDGTTVHAQLFNDPGIQGNKPGVVFMHGGPIRQMLLGFHYSDYYIKNYAFNQYLAKQGYAVISVNFRSGTGYGRSFRRAESQGPRGASEYMDVLAAAAYLQGLPYVNAESIGLWGGSYGGYLTAMGLARNSDIFVVGVDIHGVHDWVERAKKFSPGGGWGLTEDDYDLAFKSSPVANLDTWKSPVLLVHGDDDRNVLFQQSTDLSVRLKERKVHVDELILPDEVHGFLLHTSWHNIFETAFRFFNRFLKN